MENSLDIAAKNDLVGKIKSIDSKIKDYGEGLKQGRTFDYSFVLAELKGEHPDHIGFDVLHDSTCSHCGKKQAWGMDPADGAIFSGCLTSALGLILMIVITWVAAEISDAFGIAALVISAVGSFAAMYLLPKRRIKKSQAEIAAEPNDPEKLPVLDMDLK